MKRAGWKAAVLGDAERSGEHPTAEGEEDGPEPRPEVPSDRVFGQPRDRAGQTDAHGEREAGSEEMERFGGGPLQRQPPGVSWNVAIRRCTASPDR